MLTFSKALIIFAIALTLIYTAMLWVIGKQRTLKTKKKSMNLKSRIHQGLVTTSLILSAIGLSLTLLTDFRETIPYYIIITIVPILNVIAIIHRPSSSILTSFILWHLMMLWSRIPLTGIALGEGARMIREMALNDHWHFKWAHNPSYNPLPTIAFIQATLSRITSLEWYSWYLGSIVFLTWAIAYDLAVYLLTQSLTNDRRAALLAIPLIAITPEVAIHQHPYQWSGNMLVLLATLMLIKLMSRRNTLSNSLIIALCFTGAILAHATGIAFLFILIALVLTKVLTPLLRKIRLNIVRTIPRLSGVVPKVAIIIIVILFIRAAYTYGYTEYIVPTLRGAIYGLIDFLKGFFTPTEETELSEVYHIPLYERAGVPFIQAYAWSFAAALATAYILYSIIKRQINTLHISLYLTVMLILAIAFIGYALIKERYFYTLNRTTYVFIPFLLPLAALTLRKTLTLNTRKLWIITIASLILFTFTTPIAAQDPNISPIQYAKIRRSEPVQLTSEDLVSVKFILKRMEYISSTHTLYIHSFQLYRTGRYRLVLGREAVGIWYPIYTCKLEQAIELYSFINKLPKPKTVVIIHESEIPISHNLIYNTGITQVYLVRTK